MSSAADRTASADAPSPGRRGSGRESTRNALMDAAADLFAANGYGDTTVPAIVAATGVGHGTFYEYFGSRRDILVAITERAAATQEQRPAPDDRPLADQIRREITWYLVQFVENLTLSRIWHVAAGLDPEVGEMVGAARRRRTAQVRDVFAGLDLPGGADPAATAVALTAMLEEFAHRWFVEGEGPGTTAADVLAAADTLTALTLAALGLDDA